jgi:hypothetical protein
LFQGGEATDEFYLGSIVNGAAEDDVVLCMTTKSGPVSGVRVIGAWACGDVFSAQTKVVRVIHIEAVCNCEEEEDGGDEPMAHSNGALYARRGIVTIRGCVGDVGGMVGRGVICEDFLPHYLFGWGVIIERVGVPIVRSVGYLRPVIRSISYLRLSALEVRLVP